MTGRSLTHDEVQELLGAYALDAVEADEVALVEDHLRGCPRCRAEAAAHRETAAMLAHGHAEPPADLWNRVAATLEDIPPQFDLSPSAASHRPVRLLRLGVRIATVAAAVAAVIGLTAVARQQDRELDRVQAALEEKGLASAALAAFADPAARPITLHGEDVSIELRAVVLGDGTGYVVADRLPRLPPERTYQLWAMLDGEPISAGILGRRPTVAAFHVSDRTGALAITEERAGGAPRPTRPPLLTGRIGA